MPFTFSHPAIVLPFRLLPKNWISLTGLIIGSIVPDFEKFVNMAPGNTISHAKAGVFLFNLPLGILLSFVFHGVVRDPLVNNLPVFLKRRFILLEELNWVRYFSKHYIKVCVSIIVGAALHIGWDSMTHKTGLIVRLVPELTQVIEVGDFREPLYSLLDIISTSLGGIFIFYTIFRLPNHPTIVGNDIQKSPFWFIVALVFICILALRALAGLGQEWHWDMIISSITAFLIGIIVSSLVSKYYRT